MSLNTNSIIYMLLGAVIAFGIMFFTKDSSSFLNSQSDSAQIGTEGANQNQWATPADDSDEVSEELNVEHLTRVLQSLNVTQQQAILQNQESFKRLVEQENANLSVLRAAQENQLEEDQNAQFLMQRSAENVLRQAYLNILIQNKLPKDFPTNQQVEEYYEANKDRFVIAERVHVWQIFLALNAEADDNAANEKIAELKEISQQIARRQIDFASAARQFSEHDGSRNNGGYMGLVNIQELLPEIREPILQIAEDTLSEPIRTDAGVHLVKRGPMIDPLPVELKEVESQIKQLLIRQVSQQLQTAILQEALKQYGDKLDELPLEEWRLSLSEKLAN